ncbi:MAG: hypothetical protein U0469_01575 [Candidatus Paceibacterota bacterium]
MSSKEVLKMAEIFLKNKQSGSKRKLHVGVMMNYKTLNGIPSKWENAFPKKEEVSSIFLGHPSIFNVLHYADYEGVDVLENLFKATDYAGNHLNGLQLDMIWPEVDVLKEYRKKYPLIKIILQGNTEAFKLVGNDIDVFVQRVKEYKYSVDYILLDKSMGRGLNMDAQDLIPIAKSIHENISYIGIVVAGGLGPNTLNLVEPLAKEFPKISIDAQGKLRPSGNALDPIDWNMAGDYLAKALKLLK